MNRQLALALDSRAPLPVARTAPRVWLEELGVYERPGEVVRRLPFHRGLNVVWAPDDGPRGPARGHGAGKTVLCRLIRYVLGEAQYATGDQLEKIRDKMPDGFVAARVHVAGTPWWVVRALCGTRPDRASSEADLYQLLGTEEGSCELADYQHALRSTVGPLAKKLPGGAPDPWLAVLEWIAREQGCLEQPLVWRGRVPKAWRASAARLLLRFDPPAARRSARDGTEAEERYRRHQQALEAARGDVRRIEDRLEGPPGVTKLRVDIEVERRLLQERRAELRRPPEDAPALVEKAREQRDLADDLANLRGRALADASEQSMRQQHIDALARELDKLDAHEKEARASGIRVCGQCHRRLVEPAEVDAHIATMAEKREQVEVARAAAEQEHRDAGAALGQLQALVKERAKRLEFIDSELAQLRGEQKRALLQLGKELGTVELELRLLTDLRKAQAEVQRLEASTPPKPSPPREDAGPDPDPTQWADFTQALTDLARQLIGAKASAKPNRTAHGFDVSFYERDDHPASGPGLETLGALAFDLAALRMAIADRADLPGLWIHDSPRETNLGPGRSASLLEALLALHKQAGPAFQYILTTTDSPPEGFRDGVMDRNRLGSASDADLLLGQRF